VPVADTIGDICGDSAKAAIKAYQKSQDPVSVFEILYTLMDWARVQYKNPGCFVEAYLSVGFTAGSKAYM
jgi:hypothetical protein